MSAAASHCPSCGRPVPPAFHFDWERGLVAIGARRVRLTPQQSDLLAALAARAGHVASHAYLISRVFGAIEPASDPIKHVQVLLCQLRKKLTPDLVIENVFARGYVLHGWPAEAPPVADGCAS